MLLGLPGMVRCSPPSPPTHLSARLVREDLHEFLLVSTDEDELYYEEEMDEEVKAKV
jgi:hypothetical protein